MLKTVSFDSKGNIIESVEGNIINSIEDKYDENISYYNQLNEAQKEYIDDMVDDTGYSNEILAEVFLHGNKDGEHSFMLGICNKLNEID